jgi:hypothetical protein
MTSWEPTATTKQLLRSRRDTSLRADGEPNCSLHDARWLLLRIFPIASRCFAVALHPCNQRSVLRLNDVLTAHPSHHTSFLHRKPNLIRSTLTFFKNKHEALWEILLVLRVKFDANVMRSKLLRILKRRCCKVLTTNDYAVFHNGCVATAML